MRDSWEKSHTYLKAKGTKSTPETRNKRYMASMLLVMATFPLTTTVWREITVSTIAMPMQLPNISGLSQLCRRAPSLNCTSPRWIFGTKTGN